jgi:hypothetical protein
MIALWNGASFFAGKKSVRRKYAFRNVVILVQPGNVRKPQINDACVLVHLNCNLNAGDYNCQLRLHATALSGILTESDELGSGNTLTE